jgi:hypothetical protein
MESQRKGFFAKRANTQPVMTIDVRPGKGLKAAIRNKKEAAVLKREAKAIHIWRTSTLTLLEAGPDEPTVAELNKVKQKKKNLNVLFFLPACPWHNPNYD